PKPALASPNKNPSPLTMTGSLRSAKGAKPTTTVAPKLRKPQPHATESKLAIPRLLVRKAVNSILDDRRLQRSNGRLSIRLLLRRSGPPATAARRTKTRELLGRAVARWDVPA